MIDRSQDSGALGWNAVDHQDLARWGLLESVARERLIDQLLLDRPLPSPERLLSLRQDLEQRLNLLDPDRRAQWLQAQGLADEDLNRMAARPWQWLMWCRDRWGSELQTIFLQRKAEFDQVSYSLLRLLDQELAMELYLQIKEGEATFSDVAAQFSCGPEKRTGGLQGPVRLGKAAAGEPAWTDLAAESLGGLVGCRTAGEAPAGHAGWSNAGALAFG